jgi:DNA helicase INO80
MNLVMQFRKVCNHPELFERKQSRTPFTFQTYYSYYTGNMAVGFGQLKDISFNASNPINYHLPKLVYDDLYSNFTGRDFTNRKLFINKYFNIMSSSYIHDSLFPWKATTKNNDIVHHSNLFSFMRLTNIDEKLLELSMNYDNLYTVIVLLHALKTMNRISSSYEDKVTIQEAKRWKTKNMLWVNKGIRNLWNIDEPAHNLTMKTMEDIRSFLRFRGETVLAHLPIVTAPYFTIKCSSSGFVRQQFQETRPMMMSILAYGNNYTPKYSVLSKSESFPALASSYLDFDYDQYRVTRKFGTELLNQGYYKNDDAEDPSHIEIPSFESMIADSAKLAYLHKLLPKLKARGHRVLIFCQMTKMIDILEDYLNRMQYRFFRLDGSCNISDRRDMVEEFQTDDDIFAFVLSTRAGGLGITLTAADTVIFYDNDWNPTMDAQATDRAHRIGQLKNVYVYRLVTKGTIEERIVKRAQQKQTVQATVYSGGAFKADIFKPQDVMELLFDEGELDINETKKFIAKSGARKKGKPGKKAVADQSDTPAPKGRGKKAEKTDKESAPMEIEAEKDSEYPDKKGGESMEMDMDIDFSDVINNDDT